MKTQLNIHAIAAALDTAPHGVCERYRLHEGLTLQKLVRIVGDTDLTYDEVLL